ncbi:MAG: DsbA family protein, partial [Pseudomonadota bacterium]|nr:DsbA family protein [Pseudomonadota bacterium]
MAFKGPGRLSEKSINTIAVDTGLDMDRFKRDMEDPALAAQIDANHTLASDLGIRGTPAFIVGDEIARGALDLAAMESLIKKARETE